MSRLPRPHIPIAVRVQVAERQVTEAGHANLLTIDGQDRKPLRERLSNAIDFLFGNEPVHLDHDPPLGAREKIMRDGEIIGYKPDANDPRYLIYRTKVDHKLKTNVRGEHGQHPDRVLIKKQRRRERPPSKRRKIKIKSRGFQKGPKRKWPSRSFH